MDALTSSAAAAATHLPGAEVLLRQPGLCIERAGRYLLAILTEPHQVLSTCAVNGGLRANLRYLLNHQSCEGKDHQERHDLIKGIGLDGYHHQVCGDANIPGGSVAMMGTAANMNYASILTIRDSATSATGNPADELVVTAVVTAGVQGNAACAGDPATWRETDTGWEKVAPLDIPPAAPHALAGTINTMLLINRPLTEGALARAVVTMTEAKSAALTRLAIGSRYSPDAATGTGTDQFCIAACLSQHKPLAAASQHVRLGEMIGLTVRDATLEALRWQNGLEASYTRGVFHALERFGVKEKALLSALEEHLEVRPLELLRANDKSVFYEPMVSAAAYAMAAVLDRVRYQTLPATLAHDALRHQAASMASALAARPGDWPSFYQQLRVADVSHPLPLVAQAIALGWTAKWS
ncbi:MAG: adenosylcobinamide amidohydrolase [Bryobacterales bacterium]|nr:adenosylcobinamide amidohydrolase [Bryobacterales bacterium]